MNSSENLVHHHSYVGRKPKCPDCGSYLDESGACPYCANRKFASESMKGVFGFFAILLGLEAPGGFDKHSFFSKIFCRHSEQETEELLSRGLLKTIPSIGEVSTEWPSPWLFTRFLIVSGLAAMAAHLGMSLWPQFNIHQLPIIIFTDCALLPLATALFYYEMNVRRSASLFLITGLFVVGGAASLMFTALIQPAVQESFNVNWLNNSVAGLTEEPAKLLAVLVFVKAVRRRPYILDGLVMGAAVGAGFAVFESCGYALECFLGGIAMAGNEGIQEEAAVMQFAYDTMCANITLRAWLAPFMHVTWTAITAAGLFYVKGSSRFRFGMLFDGRFMRIFVFAVIMHMFWNTDWLLGSVENLILKVAIILSVELPVLFTLIAAGLQQVRREKEYCQSHPGAIEDGMDWVPAVRDEAERAAASAQPAAAEEEETSKPKMSVYELKFRQQRTAVLWVLGVIAFWIFCYHQETGRWAWEDDAAPAVADTPGENTPAASNGQESWKGRLQLYQLVAEWNKGNRDSARNTFENEVYKLLEKAYNANVPDAIADYGFLVYMGIFYEQNMSEGKEELTRAAQMGSAEAANALRQIEQGNGK